MQISLLGMDRRRYPLLADEDLISLVESGDAEAFSTLYDRHRRGVLGSRTWAEPPIYAP